MRFPQLLAILLCLGLPAAGHGQSAEDALWRQKPVRLIADDWCPQHCESGHAEKGYVVDIVSQALALEGVPFTLQYMPWARAMNKVTRGEADGLLTPTVRGFPQFLYHEKAVGFQQYCFYVDAGSDWKYGQFIDLNGKRLAYLKDSGFGPLDDYLKVNKASISTTEMTGDKDFAKRLFAFLGLKRADAVIVTSDVFAYGQAKGDIGKNFKSAGCLAQEKMAVGLSPAQPERSRAIGSALDQGIGKLRNSGALRKILARYGMTDWQLP
ncbi:MAG: transporter substrate-binding domain-containing protein [Rhodoferax sp.]|nr:transporter substrate-binding domain-containing protein [Rhodoferax sp.]